MQLEEESPAPVSTMPYPPLHTDKKFVILSDWLVPGSSSRPSSLLPIFPTRAVRDRPDADRFSIFPSLNFMHHLSHHRCARSASIATLRYELSSMGAPASPYCGWTLRSVPSGYHGLVHRTYPAALMVTASFHPHPPFSHVALLVSDRAV